MGQNENNSELPAALKTWVVSVSLLGAVAAALYFSVYPVDFILWPGTPRESLF